MQLADFNFSVNFHIDIAFKCGIMLVNKIYNFLGNFYNINKRRRYYDYGMVY